MNVSKLIEEIVMPDVGVEMYELVKKLYPICRSITGEGFLQTIEILREWIPLEIQSVPSGTQAFDWMVPKEWNIKDAYVKNSKGKRVIDFRKSNLHVVNYSIPVNKKMPLKKLQKYLHTIPEHPDWIPYRTSYYRETWGFCLTHNEFLKLEEDAYHVVIDSSLKPGYLNYGELYIPGKTNHEILISTHACHPSLCNDNLSGVVLTTFLAEYMSKLKNRYSYRFLFIPGGIGSIVWLFNNENKTSRIKHGLTVSCVGDSGEFIYKKSRQDTAEIDRAAIHVLQAHRKEHKIIDFSPYGYDERNYCSPGFNLPVGSLTRSTYSQFPQYHSSSDNLDFIRSENLAESLETYLHIVNVLENNRTYLNLNPKGETQLGKRKLYKDLGGLQKRPPDELPLLWVLNLSDGDHSLLDICERAKLSFDQLREAANILVENNLLEELKRI